MATAFSSAFRAGAGLRSLPIGRPRKIGAAGDESEHERLAEIHAIP